MSSIIESSRFLNLRSRRDLQNLHHFCYQCASLKVHQWKTHRFPFHSAEALLMYKVYHIDGSGVQILDGLIYVTAESEFIQLSNQQV